MARDTFLELVSDLITETGLNGGNPPSSVTSATGDAAKVVYWLRIADMQLQRERIDWDFLWQKDLVNLTQSSAIVPLPEHTVAGSTDSNDTTALINIIAEKRLAIIDSNGEAYFPEFLEWNEFSPIYDYETQAETDTPSFWSIKPDRTLILSEPMASAGLTCKYEYWRKPIRMRADTDVSRIPDDFSRLIVLLAKILYAEHEDAPEVDAGSTAHYEIMFNQMLSVHTPLSKWQRMENSNEPMQVETRVDQMVPRQAPR